MDYPEEQIKELKYSFPNNEIKKCDEAGVDYLLIPAVTLPEGCTPATVDLLFCPTTRDGYASRLFFSERVLCKQSLNWNATVVILGKTWYAYSWRIDGNQSLLKSIFSHLRALR